MVVCLIPVGQAYYLSMKHEKQQEHLRDFIKGDNSSKKGAENQETTTGQDEDVKQKGAETSRKRNLFRKYQKLQSENKDFVGWLSIEGTKIDDPVVQCKEEGFYLSHNFYKEKDKYGCLFVKSLADVNTPGTNFIIYGHHMRDGFMFGTLDKYEEEAFYQEHKLIFFDTIYEERKYEILSVFQIDIQDANVFPYYEFYQAANEEEFLDFYRNVKELSIYDTGITARYGDAFLTLSTCSGIGEGGRFVVVAKQVVD